MPDPDSKSTASSPLLWVLIGYAALVLLGAALLRSPLATHRGNELSLSRSVFTACNVVSLTGFPTTAVRPEDLAEPGRWTLLGLLFGSIVLTLTGAGLSIARISALSISPRRLLLSATLCSLLAGLLGSATLVDPQTDFFASVLNALAAFGNCALYMGSVPGPTDALKTYMVLLPLALVGSLGVAAVIDLCHGRLSIITQRSLTLLSAGYLAGFALLWIVHQLCAATAMSAANSSVLSITTRSYGLSIVPLRELPRVVQWTLLPLMMLGGISGGTAGGIKLTTLVVLLAALRRSFRGQSTRPSDGMLDRRSEISGRAADHLGNSAGHSTSRNVGIAGLWLGLYFTAMMLTTLLLLGTVPELNADQAPFLAVSALSCVGLARDPISITGSGLYVLSLAMLFGRIVPLLILWWSANVSTESPEPVG